MTPLEALGIVGLEPGKRYTAAHLKHAVEQEETRALRRFRHPGIGAAKGQEQAMQAFPLIAEAEKVLKGCMVGGILCVPSARTASTASTTRVPGRPRATAARPKAAPAAARRQSTPRAGMGTHQVWPMFFKGFRAARDLLFFSWWALTLPVRLLAQRKLVSVALSFLLVSGTLWLSWAFLTGGALGVSQTAETISGWLDNTLVGVVTGQRNAHGPHAGQDNTHLSLDLDAGMHLWLDGKPVPAGKSSLVVSDGQHSIELKESNGQRLCSGTLCFPAGGSWQIVCHSAPSGRPEVALQVQARSYYKE
jgi:hypothetical protein